MPTADKFRETYKAWKRASDQHRDMMSAVMAGEPLDGEAMDQKLGEIDVLHEEWMELAADFAPTRMPGAQTEKPPRNSDHT